MTIKDFHYLETCIYQDLLHGLKHAEKKIDNMKPKKKWYDINLIHLAFYIALGAIIFKLVILYICLNH